MYVDRARHRVPRRLVALWVTVLVASSCSAAALGSAGATQKSINLTGTWSGSYTGGSTGTFTLHWTQVRSKLTGTIALSNPHGTYNITGSVNRTGIHFGTVGVGVLYSGSVSALGLSMSGNWTSGPAHGSWNAHRLLTPTKTKVKKY